MALTRKAFLVQMVGGGWVLSGCGGGGDGGGGGGPPPPSGGVCGVSISGNHGHTLSLPITDLDSPTDKTYNIQGGAAHNHTVTFTVAQLALLKAGQTVTVTSSFTIDHEHSVAERCV